MFNQRISSNKNSAIVDFLTKGVHSAQELKDAQKKLNQIIEEKEEELKLFWGMGQINKENVVGIGSPAAHERMCTLGENNTLKLWSFKGKERKIIF